MAKIMDSWVSTRYGLNDCSSLIARGIVIHANFQVLKRLCEDAIYRTPEHARAAKGWDYGSHEGHSLSAETRNDRHSTARSAALH